MSRVVHRVGRVGALALAAAIGWAGRARAQEAPPRVTFDEAVKRALAQNPNAKVAAEEIHRAHALMEEARAPSLPTLVGNATYTRLDGDRTLGANVLTHADTLSANLTLTVPLVNTRAWTQWSHASDNLDVARASAADVQRQLAVAVGRAYLLVVAQKRELVSTSHQRDTARKHFDFAHQRFAGGVGNRIDEVRAAQDLATDEALMARAELAVVRAREALGVLLGVEGPLDTADDALTAELPTLATALDESRTKRADVVALERRAHAADRVVKHAWADYMPILNAVVQPFYQNPESVTIPQTGWQAQLLLSLPLYDGGLRYGQEHEREALATEAHLGVEATLRQARSEVRAAFESVRRADDALTAARQAAQLAKEALDLATLSYSAGATTNLEVIDAARRWRDAESAAIEAEDTSRNARLDLLAASGRFPAFP